MVATTSPTALTVTNTGDRAGRETVQVYVTDPQSSVFRPEQELKGFAKVSLEPGASTRTFAELAHPTPAGDAMRADPARLPRAAPPSRALRARRSSVRRSPSRHLPLR